MSHTVDFLDISTTGLESSPYAEALAGLRAHEARYFHNKYGHAFTVDSATPAPEIVERVSGILTEERDLHIASTPLQVSDFEVNGTRWSFVFFQSGLAINVMYALDPAGKRAVGFKLSEGMAIPDELTDSFKFARQRSKLAGVIRGSFFVVKGDYP